MTHTQRWHAHRHTAGRGHLYQSRFKSFAIQRDFHFLSVARYAERNPLRANLVERARDWRWGSLWLREHADDDGDDGDDDGRSNPLRPLLAEWPVDRPANYPTWVERPQDEREPAALRLARDRGRPYGGDAWARRTAARLGVESALRPVGRPSNRNVAKAGE